MTIEEVELWVSIEQILTFEEFELFEMKYKWKMTQRQIAEEVGCCRPWISKRLKRIRKKLQKSL